MSPENLKLAAALDRMGHLLHLAGADRFRVKAYARAARSIAAAGVDVVAQTRSHGVPDLPGIGPRMAALILRYAEDGELPGLEDLEREVPSSLLELLRVPRLNVRRIRILQEKLGVRSLEDLRKAASEHRLAGVKGLGARVETEVLEALDTHRAALPHRRADLEELVRDCAEFLGGLAGVRAVHPAGALRRRCELVPSLDFLLVVDNGVQASELALSLVGWGSMEGLGADSLRLTLEGGVTVHLTLADEKSAASALLKATGSAAHLAALGPLPKAGKKPLEEAGIYERLGLPYIEPELREGRGEVEAARAETLPKLIRLEDLKGDLHSHTDRTDGRNSLEEMADAALARGHTYLAVTDHTKSLKITGGQDEVRLREQIRQIDRLNGKLRGLRLLKAAEVDILVDGSLDLPDDLLRELDLTVCSVHSKFTLPVQAQTDRVLRALSHPSFRILGHPTGRLLLRRRGHPIDVDRVIQEAKALGRVLELNAQPDRLDLDDQACLRAKRAGVRIAISSDAHGVSEFDYLRWGVDQARRGWIEAKDVINTLPLPQLLKALAG